MENTYKVPATKKDNSITIEILKSYSNVEYIGKTPNKRRNRNYSVYEIDNVSYHIDIDKSTGENVVCFKDVTNDI